MLTLVLQTMTRGQRTSVRGHARVRFYGPSLSSSGKPDTLTKGLGFTANTSAESFSSGSQRVNAVLRSSPSWLCRTTTSGPVLPGPWWRSVPTERTARRRGPWSCRPRGGGRAVPARAAFPHRVSGVQCPSRSCCGCRCQCPCQHRSEHSVLITRLCTRLKISRAFSYFIFLSEK